MTVKKLLALAALPLLLVLSVDATSAHPRRRAHRHARVWVGARIVVARPVIAAPIVIGGRAHGAIDLDVKPEETLVYVNGEMRGTTDDFDGFPAKLNLLPGKHRIKLEAPDGETWSRTVRVVADHEINIRMEMDD